MERWPFLLAGAVLMVGAALGFSASRGPGPEWQKVRWPFPQDAWPAGRAFRCQPASCGGEVEVYIRAKRGLCANCATGVTDDAEVDAVADLDMMSQDFVPDASGEHVSVGDIAGRMRTYTLRLADGTRMPAVGYVMSRAKQCDLVVVAGQGSGADTAASRSAIRALLLSAPAAGWIDAQLNGR